MSSISNTNIGAFINVAYIQRYEKWCIISDIEVCFNRLNATPFTNMD